MKSLLHRRSQSAGGPDPQSKGSKNGFTSPSSPTMIMSPGSRSPEKGPPKSPSKLSVSSVFRRMSTSSPPKSPTKSSSPQRSPTKSSSPFTTVLNSTAVKKALASHYSTTPRIEQKGHRKSKSAGQPYSSMIIDGEKREYVRTPVLPEKYPKTTPVTPNMSSAPKTPNMPNTPKTPKTEPRSEYDKREITTFTRLR